MGAESGRIVLLVNVELHEAGKRLIVDRENVQTPGGTVRRVAAIAGNAMIGPSNASSSLVSMCNRSPGAACSL